MDVATPLDALSRTGASTLRATVTRAIRRNAVLIAALALLANSVLRGMRMPGYWAATHLLFNYQFGFQRSQTPAAATAAPGPIALLSVPGILIMLNLTSAVPLFDDYVVEDFPYHDHLKDVHEILRGHGADLQPHRGWNGPLQP